MYVNGRFVKNRNIQQALCEGFRGRLIKGRYPVAVIFLKVPFDRLDVNVHPTKHEVRFADQQHIYTALRDTVVKALQQAEQPRWGDPEACDPVSSSDGGNGEKKEGPPRVEEGAGQTQAPPVGAEPETFDANSDAPAAPVSVSESMAPAETEESHPVLPDAFSDAEPSVASIPDVTAKEPLEQPFAGKTPPASSVASPRSRFSPVSAGKTQYEFWKPSFFSDLVVIGQLHDTYILCESRDGLILIDQHAAHERIVYEDLKKKSQKDSGRSQHLLIPETIELGYHEADVLSKILPELNRLGLQVEPFGGRSFVVKAVPELMAGQCMAPLIRQMSETMLSSGGDSLEVDEVLEAFLILMACHGAIRAHQTLSMQQMQALLLQLDACENASHCPHGRPLWIQWSASSLEKAFARVV
jgi:DNA mismatch repair protein MutL